MRKNGHSMFVFDLTRPFHRFSNISEKYITFCFSSKYMKRLLTCHGDLGRLLCRIVFYNLPGV